MAITRTWTIVNGRQVVECEGTPGAASGESGLPGIGPIMNIYDTYDNVDESDWTDMTFTTSSSEPDDQPVLGAWADTSGFTRKLWIPSQAGTYKYYVFSGFNIDDDPTAGASYRFYPPVSDLLDNTWGGDFDTDLPSIGTSHQAVFQGTHRVTQAMIDNNVGGLVLYKPTYETSGLEAPDYYECVVAIESWDAPGTDSVEWIEGLNP
jgi:hypothetical protein